MHIHNTIIYLHTVPGTRIYYAILHAYITVHYTMLQYYIMRTTMIYYGRLLYRTLSIVVFRDRTLYYGIPGNTTIYYILLQHTTDIIIPMRLYRAIRDTTEYYWIIMYTTTHYGVLCDNSWYIDGRLHNTKHRMLVCYTTESWSILHANIGNPWSCTRIHDTPWVYSMQREYCEILYDATW